MQTDTYSKAGGGAFNLALRRRPLLKAIRIAAWASWGVMSRLADDFIHARDKVHSDGRKTKIAGYSYPLGLRQRTADIVLGAAIPALLAVAGNGPEQAIGVRFFGTVKSQECQQGAQLDRTRSGARAA